MRLAIENIPLVLTVEEAAELLRCEPKTIERYIHSHELSAIQIGRSARIRGEDLAEFVTARPLNRLRKRNN